MNKMFHFKHSDGGISFIGWNEEKKVYSRQYYANVGIMNAEESKHVRYKDIMLFTYNCEKLGFKEVTYLPKEEQL